MPCIYAHDSFGRKVASRLPEELKTIIENHPKEFNAGLQGPDFLFFYHPLFKTRTNQMGYWQHGQPIDKYLRRLLPILRHEGIRHLRLRPGLSVPLHAGQRVPHLCRSPVKASRLSSSVNRERI